MVCFAAVGLLMLPDGSRMGRREVWKSELNQSQFELWAKTLTDMGLEITPEDFEATLWDGVQNYLAIRDPAAGLVEPIAGQVGVAQGWKMFSNPQTHPARLRIDIDRGEGFETLYISRSDEHAWRREQFDHNRTRKLIGRIVRKGRRRTYAVFVAWVAQQVKDEFPDAQRVRVRLFRWRTPAPGKRNGRYDEGGKYEARRVRTLRRPQ